MLLKKMVCVAMLACVSALASAAQEGKDYEVLTSEIAPVQKDKIEVTEFFAYWCPHCHDLEPIMHKHAQTFARDTLWRPEHIVWDDQRDFGFARLAAAVKQTGLSDKANSVILKAVVEQRIDLSNENVLKQWLPAQTAFDGKKVLAAYQSFSNIPAAKQMAAWTQQYNITGTPTVVVGGKYHVLFNNGYEYGMKTIDELIQKVRQERGMPASAPKTAAKPVKSWGARWIATANH